MRFEIDPTPTSANTSGMECASRRLYCSISCARSPASLADKIVNGGDVELAAAALLIKQRELIGMWPM